MPSSCSRLWQVEAARDGRLSLPERADLERHLATCDACACEQRALNGLADKLREVALSVDDLGMRRLRQRTLELADSGLRTPEPRERKYRPWLSFAVAAVALVSLSVGLYSVSALRRFEQTLLEQADGQSGDEAKLSDVTEPPTPIKALETDSQTRTSAPAAELPSARERTNRARPVPPKAPALQSQIVPAEPRNAAPAEGAEVDLESPSGDPKILDSEDEDLTYLRIVALVRAGRVDQARLEARSYLSKFPHAFRRIEIERLAR